MIKKDYNFEQVEKISKLLFTILFPKAPKKLDAQGNVVDYVDNYAFDTKSLELKLLLIDKLKENKFGEAEDILYKYIEKDSGEGCLQIAVWFYLQLNKLDNETLEHFNFPRGEVLSGIQRIESMVIENSGIGG